MKNLLGKKFGKLTVVEHIKQKHWLCKCECGNDKVTTTEILTGGHLNSCRLLTKY